MEKKDAKMLKFIRRRVTFKDIAKKFGDNEETVSRVQNLAYNPVSGERLIWMCGEEIYELTGEGMRLLCDHKVRSRSERVRVYLPVAVSILALVKSFWAEITTAMKVLIELLLCR